jgi:hypothetical protein
VRHGVSGDSPSLAFEPAGIHVVRRGARTCAAKGQREQYSKCSHEISCDFFFDLLVILSETRSFDTN